MLKFLSLFAYINYFTSPQIRRFKPLCYNMDTLYLFQKIMQYRPPYTPPTPRYRPPLPTPYRSQTPPMMMFAKFFWEIFLDRILRGCFSKNFFWEFFGKKKDPLSPFKLFGFIFND